MFFFFNQIVLQEIKPSSYQIVNIFSFINALLSMVDTNHTDQSKGYRLIDLL